MKNLNKLLITLFLAFSFNSMASSIESLVLNDNSIVSKKEISAIHFSSDNSVEFVELNDGSKIEGSEVKSLNFSSKLKAGFQTMGAVRTGGDGSGG